MNSPNMFESRLSEIRYYQNTDGKSVTVFKEDFKKLMEYKQAEEQGLLIKLPAPKGTEILLDTDLLGCDIGKMPYRIMDITINVFGDWGGATQSRTISLEDLQKALKGSVPE